MRQPWIAFLLVPAVAFVGCSSDPEPVAEVPPPTYVAEPEPEPLPPVSINEGAPIDSGANTAVTLGPEAGASSYEPEPLTLIEPAIRTYKVRKGDTLWSIAKREYGDGQKWKAISAANQSIDPKKLVVGQEIVLP